ncbi:hypothetical protein [Pseudomonas abietaniphila]|nr:hypothetical protein [Pseudomonas abietaniphila]
MSAKTPTPDPRFPEVPEVPEVPDETPEYPLSAPVKPDDPERRSEQSRAETEGCVEE